MPLLIYAVGPWLPAARHGRGQTLVEYGLVLTLVALIVIIALLFLGPIVSRMFQNVGTNLNGAGS